MSCKTVKPGIDRAKGLHFSFGMLGGTNLGNPGCVRFQSQHVVSEMSCQTVKPGID